MQFDKERDEPLSQREEFRRMQLADTPLEKAGLKASPKKCEVGQSHID